MFDTGIASLASVTFQRYVVVNNRPGEILFQTGFPGGFFTRDRNLPPQSTSLAHGQS